MIIELIIGLVILVLFILFIRLIVLSYKKVSSNEALVVWGAGIKNGFKIKKGGASFVIPGLQQSATLSFRPIVVPVQISDARSSENVEVSIDSVFTLSIGDTPELLNTAATKILELTDEDIRNQCQQIIEGQLRAIIVKMTLDEINSDRSKFESQIAANTAVELAKLGLDLTNNPNIKQIEDQGGYFEARGKKASAEALNEANIDIANATKKGEIGTKEAQREQEIRTAELNAEQEVKTAEYRTNQQIGVKEAEKNQQIRAAELTAEQEVKTAESLANQEVGMKSAQNEKAIKSAQLDALKIQEQNKSKAIAAESEKELLVKQALYTKESESARIDAQTEIQNKNAEQELAALRAKEVAKVKAQKEMVELEAEAQKNKTIKEAEAKAQEVLLAAQAEAEGKLLAAKAEAEGKLLAAKAEAEGIDAIMKAKSEGYGKLSQALGKDELANIMMLEQLVDVTKVKADAISNIEIDKITVWDNPSSNADNSGLTGFVDKIQSSMGMHEIARDSGIVLPAFMGALDEQSEPNSEQPENL